MEFAKEHLKDSDLSYGTCFEKHRPTNAVLTLCIKNYSELKNKVIYYASYKICEHKLTIKLVIANETLFVFMSSANINLEHSTCAIFKADGKLKLNDVTQWNRLMISEFCHKAIMDPKTKYLRNDRLVIKIKYETKYEKSRYLTDYGSLRSDQSIVQLCTNLEQLYLTADNSDIKLQVQGETFWLHKAVLAARSKTFADFFRNNSSPPNKVTYIAIDEDPIMIHKVLDYIYRGVVDCIDVENVLYLLEIASELNIESLKQKCIHYLNEQ